MEKVVQEKRRAAPDGAVSDSGPSLARVKELNERRALAGARQVSEDSLSTAQTRSDELLIHLLHTVTQYAHIVHQKRGQ